MNQAATMTGPGQAEELRAAMAGALRDEGVIVSGPVAAAFAAVPRHLFAPGESLGGRVCAAWHCRA
jgi:protein-L-isoaspartate(D-aspartate) O-methyltransferase